MFPHGEPGPRRVAFPNFVDEALVPASTPEPVPPSPRYSGDASLDLNGVLGRLLESGGSDLHLTSGAPPAIRRHGDLHPVPGLDPLTSEVIERAVLPIVPPQKWQQFLADQELDFAHTVPGVARFRVNLFRQRESIGGVFRIIPWDIRPLEALGMPPVLASFAGLPRGLVLVTGPTGSGKSTTLAAMVDLANRTRKDHIMTVEDPIEFLHQHRSCLVNQREVGTDTRSFSTALKHVLRQDPDIILVGEMRDVETVAVALTAAETGHLVFATLHTQDAPQTIDRVIDVFPSHQQSQVRSQLGGALQGVVSQSLCRRADGAGRVAAIEVLVATPAVRNLIREGKTHQVYSLMQSGGMHGMQTLDQHLAMLVQRRTVRLEDALEKCHNVDEFQRLVGRI